MGLSARDLARLVLTRVDKGAYATLALGGELERARLSAQDRGLATELVYGVIKQRLRLDRALASCAPRGLSKLDESTRTALRLGAYQLLFLRVPAHAAVNDAVEAVRKGRGERLAGFVNALLRKLSQTGEPALPTGDTAADLSIRHSVPEWLAKGALLRLGAAEANRYLAALNEPPPLWLRLNTLRGTREQALAALQDVTPSARLPEAVKGRGQGLFDRPAYGEGWFIAQDLGAQLVARLLFASGAALPDGPILDACAGLGGKSTHLAALTANRVDIDAADLSTRKLELCADHAHRLGCTRITTRAADLTQPDVPLRPAYAAVLLDAPCTGLGVLRRHGEARWRVRPEQIAALAALQKSLLYALWRRVMPGGLLVYSVCTYTDEEGPGQIAAFLKDHGEFAIVPPLDDSSWPTWRGLLDDGGALHTWPQRDDADAFYAVRLRRRG